MRKGSIFIRNHLFAESTSPVSRFLCSLCLSDSQLAFFQFCFPSSDYYTRVRVKNKGKASTSLNLAVIFVFVSSYFHILTIFLFLEQVIHLIISIIWCWLIASVTLFSSVGRYSVMSSPRPKSPRTPVLPKKEDKEESFWDKIGTIGRKKRIKEGEWFIYERSCKHLCSIVWVGQEKVIQVVYCLYGMSNGSRILME